MYHHTKLGSGTITFLNFAVKFYKLAVWCRADILLKAEVES
jgi:hypothetical protein